MRLVPQAVIRPHHCAMLPHLGSAHVKGYVDTGSELPGFDNHGYASVVFVEEAARKLLGWSSPEVVKELEDRLAERDRTIEDLRAQLEEADRHLSAIEVMESAGFRARKKPGRPRKAEEQAA